MFSLLAAAVGHIAITAAMLQGLPQQTISATDEHGQTAQYSGVALRDVLTRQGVPAGNSLHGKAMTRFVVVGADDGYRVVLIATARDGAAFSAHEGPFRSIVPGEKWEARWVRQVSTVDVEDIP